jgi:rod shape-determining protein MreD
MWKKLLIIVFLFYLFILLQNSFLAHFDIFGVSPNLVFVLFFLLVFFEKKDKTYRAIFLAITAGLFLDIFSFTCLGPSIIVLIIIALLLKKAQSMLKNREDTYPFVYFLPLFIIFFLVYDLLLGLTFYFFDPNKIIISFGTETIFAVIYNSLVASSFFYIYKKFFKTAN